MIGAILAAYQWSGYACNAAAQSTIDTGKWAVYSRAGAPLSNLQCFTPDNVDVHDGFLYITSKIAMANCKSFDLKPATYRYTSGFVAMRSFNFLYGTIYLRAKLSGGNHSGAWPVIWMADDSCQASDPTGTDDNCNEQEIDIAEILDGTFSVVNEQIHVDHFAHNDGCKAPINDASTSYHVYSLDWEPGSLVYKIDGKITCTIEKPYIPNRPMYLKMNVFVGGYGGPVNDHTFPWGTGIDYVRIVQKGVSIFDDEFDSPIVVPKR